MLSFFRSSQPLALPALLLYALLVQAVPLLMSLSGEYMSLARSFADPSPADSLIGQLLGFAQVEEPQGRAGKTHPLLILAAAGMIALQAILVNRSLKHIKGLSSAGYLPALFYILFAACLGLAFNATGLGLFALLLAFDRLIRAYGAEPGDSLLLQCGFWIGIAGAFNSLYFVFLPFSLLMAANIRPLNFRELGVLAAGTLSVPLMVLTAYYVFDRWELFLAFEGLMLPQWPPFQEIYREEVLRLALPVSLALAGLVTAGQRQLKALIQVRKISTWTAIFAVFAVLVWILGMPLAVPAVFPMAYFTAFMVNVGQRNKAWEFVHLLMLLLLMIAQWSEASALVA